MKIQLGLVVAAGTLLVLSDAVVGQKTLRSRSVANTTSIPLNAPYRRLLAGETTNAPPSNRNATTSAAERALPTAKVENEDDGFTVVDGVVYMLRGGKRAGRLEADVVLRISPNGVVTGFDGSKYRIPPGEMLRMDGQLGSLPGNSAEPAQEVLPPSPPENPTKRGGHNSQNTSRGN